MKLGIFHLITYTKRSFTKTVNRFSFCIIKVTFCLKRSTELKAKQLNSYYVLAQANFMMPMTIKIWCLIYHLISVHKFSFILQYSTKMGNEITAANKKANIINEAILQRPWFFGKIQYRSYHSHRQLLRLLEVIIKNNKCFDILEFTLCRKQITTFKYPQGDSMSGNGRG